MHEPATTVTEYQTTTILWDMPIQTDRDKSKQTRYSRERHEGKNLSAYRFVYPYRNQEQERKTTEKLTKYKDLEIKIEKCGE